MPRVRKNNNKMIEAKLNGQKQLHRDFKILTLTPDVKKKINLETIKEIRKAMMKTKRKEQTPDGEAWTPRARKKTEKTKRGKTVYKKMLKNIQKKSRNFANAEIGKFSYHNSVSGRIAAEHQEGAILPVWRNRHKKRPLGNTKKGTPRKATMILPARPFLDTDPDRNGERMEEQIDKYITKKL